jgi:hypothetical protein
LVRASAPQSDEPEDEDESPDDDEPPEDESPEEELPEDSPSDFVVPDLVPSVADPDPDDAALLSPLELAFSSFDRAARADVPRSFFAQPVPLKWTAGATNALVIVPSAPHSGQNFGPWSFMP